MLTYKYNKDVWVKFSYLLSGEGILTMIQNLEEVD